jgi:hypothetical protein
MLLRQETIHHARLLQLPTTKQFVELCRLLTGASVNSQTGPAGPLQKCNKKETNLEKFEIAARHGHQARKVHEVFIPLCVTG